MAKFKIGESRNQMVFFPDAINDYLPENHLAKVVLSIVSSLNMDTIIAKFSNVGQRAFSPKMKKVWKSFYLM